MPKSLPILVHKTVEYLESDLVDKEVMELVKKLIKQGYKVRLFIHAPHYETAQHGAQYTITSTTIVASLSDDIEISQM